MQAETTAKVKHPGGRNVPGGPPGNQKAVKHGIHGLKRTRRSSKLDKRTSFGRAFEARKAEYIAHLGGDQLRTMELAIIEDTVWTGFYTMAYDLYLSSLKNVIRKGRPHPIVDARTRLASHRRENLKTLGLKRVAKVVGIDAIKARYENRDEDNDKPEATDNGAADEG
jgi:hypothetical protein